MAWIAIEDSTREWSLNLADLAAGTIQMVNSHLIGTNVESTNGTGPCRLTIGPVGTQFRITPVSYYCPNPNPSPGTPSVNYCYMSPGVSWYDDLNGPVTHWNEAPPYPGSYDPWPADVPAVTEWIAPFPIVGRVPEFPGGYGPEIRLQGFGCYTAFDDFFGVPTDFDLLVEVWEEGTPCVDCFWTDHDNVEETCDFIIAP